MRLLPSAVALLSALALPAAAWTTPVSCGDAVGVTIPWPGGALADYGCPGGGGLDGAETTFIFTAEEAVELTVQATPDDLGTDLALLALAFDGVGFGACLIFADGQGPGTFETVAGLPLTTGQQVALVVDSSGPGGTGMLTIACSTEPEDCSDGLDNDGDGQVDCGDEECSDICPVDAPDATLLPGVSALSDTTGQDAVLTHVSCNPVPHEAPEEVFEVPIVAGAAWQLTLTSTDGVSLDLHVLGDDSGAAPWDCRTALWGVSTSGTLTVEPTVGDTVLYAVVDGVDTNDAGAFELLGELTELACDDGVDNDGDGPVDGVDPDCALPETCGNGLDDDLDGLVDGDDPDCVGQGLLPPLESCANGIDDDGDGAVDCADTECTWTAACPTPPEICCNGIDDDLDLRPDYLDPDCANTCTASPEVCDNGLDDDADGVADCGDVDCLATCGEVSVEVCGSGLDEDGDGAVDCNDGDCNPWAGCNPGVQPELCDNELDDDLDGWVDCGDAECFGLFVCIDDPACPEPSAPGALDPALCDSEEAPCEDDLRCLDADGDGYRPVDGDCQEADPSIHPGAVEFCDGIDNDCDGITLGEFDRDQDGVMTCAGDCDDLNAGIGPAATEGCDGLDSDCDGVLGLDEQDLDGDGFNACQGDCEEGDATVFPGAEELCNGRADSCGELPLDELDTDLDGVRPCDGDCDDQDPTAWPQAPELCDEADNDCDGTVDDVDRDGDGFLDEACGGEDCVDLDPAVHPGASELCASPLDEDCDGLVNGMDPDCAPVEPGDGPGGCNCAATGLPAGSPGLLLVVLLPLAVRRRQAEPGLATFVLAGALVTLAPAAASAATTPYLDHDDWLAASTLPSGVTFSVEDFDLWGVAREVADAQVLGLFVDDISLLGSSIIVSGTSVDGSPCNQFCVGPVPTGVVQDFIRIGWSFPRAMVWVQVLDVGQVDGAMVTFTPFHEDGSTGEAWSVAPDNENLAGGTGYGFHFDPPAAALLIQIDDAEDAFGIDDLQYTPDTFFDYRLDNDGDAFCEAGEDLNLDGDCLDAGETGGTAGDCDDERVDVAPGRPEACDFVDNDCDGVVDNRDIDGDGEIDVACGGLDCDDTNPLTWPGAEEICDRQDNDCDGYLDGDEFDEDLDGWVACGGSIGEIPRDCDEGDPAVNPAAVEVFDGRDNDCDGRIDEDTPASDDDGDGFTEMTGDCDDTRPWVRPGAPERLNYLDDDCDGVADDGLSNHDGDGDGFCERGVCVAGAPGDCDDSNPDTWPGAVELLDNRDNDCDGLVDEGTEGYDDDGDGLTELEGDCNDGDATIRWDLTEVADGLDNDCDLVIDEETARYDDDGDGYCEIGPCVQSGVLPGDCNDQDSSTWPGAPELLDERDNDCDCFREGYVSEPGTADVSVPSALCVPPPEDKGCAMSGTARPGLAALLLVVLLALMRRRRTLLPAFVVAGALAFTAPARAESDCDDGFDEDGDGYVDCEDEGCLDAPECPGSCDELPQVPLTCGTEVTGTTAGLPSEISAWPVPGLLEGMAGGEAVFQVSVEEDGVGSLLLLPDAPCDVDLDLFALFDTGSCLSEDVFGWSALAPTPADGDGNCIGDDSVAVGEGDWLVVVDGPTDGGGSFVLALDCEWEGEGDCTDGLDGEGDGRIDCDDDECIDDTACSAAEICGGGIDEDGDGAVDCDDPDCVGSALCGGGSTEDCTNGLDDDGDGLVDCLDPGCLGWPACTGEICSNGIDDDGDGLVDCADGQCLLSPACMGSGPEICANGVDDDGNGYVDCLDPDCSGSPPCAGIELCANGVDDDGDGLVDCDDPICALAIVCGGPGEVCNDGWDDDLDGLPDCKDPDCISSPFCDAEEDCNDGLDDDEDGLFDCADPDCWDVEFHDADEDGSSICHDCDDEDPTRYPGGPELCDGLDNDCDTLVDEDAFLWDGDGDGQPSLLCGGEDCDDTDPTVFAGATEICDGRDEDCNDVVDDVDLDGDGFFAPCGGGDDCDDLTPETWPGAEERCDGLDNDCDGEVDDIDLDGDGVLSESCGGTDCNDLATSVAPGLPEQCDDGLDNDCNGLVDHADPACDPVNPALVGCSGCSNSGPTPAPILGLLLILVVGIVGRRGSDHD